MKTTIFTLFISISLFSCSTGNKLTSEEISENNYRQIEFHETFGRELKEMGMDTSSEIEYEQANKLRKRELERNVPDSFLDFVLDIILFK